MVDEPGIFTQHVEAATKSPSVSRGEDMGPITGHTGERTCGVEVCCVHHWKTNFTTVVLTSYPTLQNILLTFLILTIKQPTIC